MKTKPSEIMKKVKLEKSGEYARHIDGHSIRLISTLITIPDIEVRSCCILGAAYIAQKGDYHFGAEFRMYLSGVFQKKYGRSKTITIWNDLEATKEQVVALLEEAEEFSGFWKENENESK